MKLSMRKIKVLFGKDFADVYKNPTVLIMVLMPILFVLLFKVLGIADLVGDNSGFYLLNMGTLMNCAMSGVMLTCTMIAEEKEKYTLRTLMLSNVKGGEFLISKLAVNFIMTTAGNIVIFLLSGTGLKDLVFYVPATLLGILPVCLISAVLGLMSRDQMSCGVLQVPVMLLFLMPPIFGELNQVLRYIAMVTPLNAMMNLYYRAADGVLLQRDALLHLLVLAVWIVIAGAAFKIAYQKKGLDN